MNMRLENKVALITGGGSGIGKASCLLFAKEGAKVIVVDLKKDTAEATANEIGDNARAFAADVSKASDAEGMVKFAEESFGRLDVIFNNAGIFHPNDESVTNTTEAIWDMVINVNLKGVFLGCQYAIPALLRAGGGSIINTASFVAIMGAAVPQIAYTASKGGVLAMTRQLALPRPCRNPTPRRAPRRSRPPQPPPRPHPHGPLRAAGGDGQCRAVPRQRRVVVHHGDIVPR
jgi:NAD(P)-dependent dehydrogenase (short-subunit alcohol dehydrogenase family)